MRSPNRSWSRASIGPCASFVGSRPLVQPETGPMTMEARIEPVSGALPTVAWRWDSETDILSGAFKGNRKSGGRTRTGELAAAGGAGAPPGGEQGGDQG